MAGERGGKLLLDLVLFSYPSGLSGGQTAAGRLRWLRWLRWLSAIHLGAGQSGPAMRFLPTARLSPLARPNHSPRCGGPHGQLPIEDICNARTLDFKADRGASSLVAANWQQPIGDRLGIK